MNSQPSGITIRYPATANLLIDSIDRTSGTSADFVINKKYSIMNGFFHRLAVTEVVVDWCVDNISATTKNNILTVDIAAVISTVTLDDGSYTVAQALDALIIKLNASALGVTFSLTDGPGYKILHGDGNFAIVETDLSIQLNLYSGVADTDFDINCPVLLPYTYIDITSPELTYNQALKDTTTNDFEQNVLYRWYLAWDTPVAVDAYNYPIYQGYERFIARRVLPFPKQIRWENNMPVGQLSFKVFSSNGLLLSPAQTGNGEFEWKMTLLVSEN